MNFNVQENLSAVDRSVSSVVRDGQPAHAVILSRSYPTSLEDLWDAVTNADRIPRWFLPISGDLELGGSYQLEGNAGGRITACQPPSQYAITWEFGGFISWVERSMFRTMDPATPASRSPTPPTIPISGTRTGPAQPA